MNKSPSFRTRARVLRQLGEQLIKNEAIALLELIKNSYDADASECVVVMESPESKKDGKIILRDNGEGMDYEILINAWLEIGTSYKEDLKSNESSKQSEKFKRLRLGEKGIGRFGVHRLGRKIKVITKKSDSKEYVLQINWNEIENSKYIEDLPISITERKPITFKDNSGTKIIISDLRVPWTRKMARDCSRSILSLNSPFESNDSFKVSFKIRDSKWLKGLLTYEDIEEYKLFSFDVTLSGNQIADFTYGFHPWPTMKKLKDRCITLENSTMKKLTRMLYRTGAKKREINLDNYDIGEVRFYGVIFDLSTRTLALGVQDKSGLKKYLKQNGGVRVFRDNMRVMDYGELGNDWLDLGGRRVNMPTKRISNNIILGAVYLDKNQSADLEEKANREGFVEDEAYWELWYAIRFAIDRIESCRKTDKDLLRKHYGPQKVNEPVISSIEELKDIIDDKVKDQPVKKEINRYLDRIETEYETITTNLLRSAGAGLNLVIIIHQIEKILKEIRTMIKKNVSNDILEDRIRSLSALVEGYTLLVKKSDKKIRNLKGIITQSLFNMQFRFDYHGIKLENGFKSKEDGLDALCSTDHVLNALMNLFDNSIWWLGYAKSEDPSIFIDITDELPDFVTIVVADNGPGFTQPTNEIIKPFVSDKPGGMGIGLHLTHQIMESLGGKILFPGMELACVPDKYEEGAIIALAFKKG